MKQESEDGTINNETNRLFQSVAMSAIVLCLVAIVNHVSDKLRASSDYQGIKISSKQVLKKFSFFMKNWIKKC